MSEYNEKDIGTGEAPEQPSSDAESDFRQSTYTDPASDAGRENNNAYWSSKDARLASQGYQQSQQPQQSQQSSQPPRQSYGGYNGYGNQQPPYEPPYSQPNSYQYSANNGWQQNSKQESGEKDKYQWNFQDYNKYETPGKKKKNRGLVVFAVSLICVLSVSLVSLSGYTLYQYFANGSLPSSYTEESSSQTPDRQEDNAPADEALDRENEAVGQMEISGKPQINETAPVGGRMTIPQVAEAVAPSVVGVVTYQNTQFFEPTGTGSGIVMSADGFIITNAHVVAGADAIKVVLHNDDAYEAKLIGTDSQTDLAVIKIEETGLTAAAFGDSSELKVGETVIAIGNPAGLLSGSVTQGIVSALNRQVQTSRYSMNYIQTDAAINPGNSGGALVNEFGQVVGINSSKIVAEGYEGIGFAIPISDAKPIIDDLLTNGRVTGRVILGIKGQVVDEVLSNSYSVPMGVQIVEMDPEADISKKGVQTGDIITHINGERIYTTDDIWKLMEGHKVGDTVQLSLYRQTRVMQGTNYDISVVLKEDLS